MHTSLKPWPINPPISVGHTSVALKRAERQKRFNDLRFCLSLLIKLKLNVPREANIVLLDVETLKAISLTLRLKVSPLRFVGFPAVCSVFNPRFVAFYRKAASLLLLERSAYASNGDTSKGPHE